MVLIVIFFEKNIRINRAINEGSKKSINIGKKVFFTIEISVDTVGDASQILKKEYIILNSKPYNKNDHLGKEVSSLFLNCKYIS